jgi:phosphate transport system substrate-binding protein
LVSGAVPDDLQKEIERRGIALMSVTAGYNAVVPVVHPSNPLASVSLKQLKNIFSGRINDWKTVGGKNASINVFVGPPSGGITETWKDAVLGDDGAFSPKAVVIGAEQRIKRVAADPAAITFLTVGELDQSVKALRIDGVAATPESVLDGRHPVRTPLMLVTTDKPSAATAAFIKYFTTPRKAFRFAGFVNAAPMKAEK